MEAERRDFPGAEWLRESKSAESSKVMSEKTFGKPEDWTPLREL